MQDASRDAIEAIITADALRCRLIETSDLEGLARLLDDGLIHVHAVGYIDDKRSYLAGLRERIEVKGVTRSRPEARLAGDCCVLIGPLTNTVRRRGDSEWVTGTSFVTQIWMLDGGEWKQTLYQATRMPTPRASATTAQER